MTKQYSWGSTWKLGDAQKIGEELEKVEQVMGELTAVNAVNYARNHTDGEIYRVLEWDDEIAGEMWRRRIASNLISGIKVTIIEDDEPKNKKPVKAYVQPTTQRVYEPIEVVVQDVNKYQQLLEKAYKELNATKNKYQELGEIQELLKDIPQY